jgi:antitoxin ParD1/3/4
MGMASLNISLPTLLREYVEAQVKEGGYSTPSEYVRALLREDQRRKVEERLEGLLLNGLQSGPPTEVAPEFWERKRRRFMERHRSKNHR